jgi:hypothetical protein
MPRRLKQGWIESYIQHVSQTTESPTKYHFWAAATVVAATLKRNVYVDRVEWKCYPNLYTILVGHPGIGKGSAMTPALTIGKKAGTINVLSDRITMEYVLERLSKGFPKINVTAQQSIKLGTESSALIVSPELSVFITASQFSITALTDLWDCREGVYQYGTRGKGEFNINEPCISLLGGSAQDWLVKSIPTEAVGGGFTRRVNFIFASKKSQKMAWPKNGNYDTFDLIEDLREISMLRGKFTFSFGAERLFERYHNSCEPNEFDDEASANFKASKDTNVLKLAQVLSASRGDSLYVTELDLQMAIQKVDEVNDDLRYVFRAVGESSIASASDKILRFIETKGYASRQDMLACNWRHVTSGDLDVVLATFREAGILGERNVGTKTLYFVK